MKRITKISAVKSKNKNILRVKSIMLGVAVNVILSFLAHKFGLPVFLDTIGTMCVAIAAGPFPGIITAVISNLLCTIFDSQSIYFGIINVFTALLAASYERYRDFKKPGHITSFIAISGIVSGVAGSLIQMELDFNTQGTLISDTAAALSAATGVSVTTAFIASNILTNILDKGVSLAAALACIHFMPAETRTRISNCRWQQEPLTVSDEKKFTEKGKELNKSLRNRLTVSLIASSFILVISVASAGINQYYLIGKQEKRENAVNAARFAASVVDPDRISDYISGGESEEGYNETRTLLERIRTNAPGVMKLYIFRVDGDSCTYVFDLDPLEQNDGSENSNIRAYKPGEVAPLENKFVSYMDDLLNGREIPLIESDSKRSWTVTAYCPVLDEDGNCVCYAGADATVYYITDYMRDYIIRIVLLLAGLMAAIIAYELWTTGVYIYYPVSKTVAEIEDFVDAGGDQEKMDAAVKELRHINIKTDDEVEKLYLEVCKMASNQAEQIRAIRRFAETTSHMQDGLIITMADLVESRDSDTGAHVQKTAAYVKIIVEGLNKKGYYAEKISPKFISDVVRSAPLHDIGKINIPDSVLNKPGKLTDEEFEIMKTHTTAGRKIIEKAIDTLGGENYLKEARNMAAYHHERWDGRGYPEGLHGEVIPLSARIMAVADVFDALTSPRVYKPAFPLDKALAIIMEGSGSQFDAKCVEVFMEALPEVKVILRKYNKQE